MIVDYLASSSSLYYTSCDSETCAKKKKKPKDAFTLYILNVLKYTGL